MDPGWLQVVTAPNAGPMTFTGTQSYVVGGRDVAVIDPGPDDARHLAGLAAAVADRRVVAVLVTHAHLDHAAGAVRFARRMRAPVLAHGDPVGARRPALARLAAAGGIGGGEGMDAGFAPDRRIGEGEVVRGAGWTLRAMATPGHTADHLGFVWDEARAIFTGDVIMGWASTLISPPDGDVAEYRVSLRRLAEVRAAVFYPGHGPPVRDPAARVADQLAHRDQREAQILAALGQATATIPDLVARIYAEVPPHLHPMAGRNVLAHLVDLVERGRVRAEPDFGRASRFALGSDVAT